jgi:carbonic anhydrase
MAININSGKEVMISGHREAGVSTLTNEKKKKYLNNKIQKKRKKIRFTQNNQYKLLLNHERYLNEIELP